MKCYEAKLTKIQQTLQFVIELNFMVIKFSAGKPAGLHVGGTAFNLPFFVLLNNFYASLSL